MTSALNEAEGHQGFTASAFEVLRLLAVYLGRPEQGAIRPRRYERREEGVHQKSSF